MPGKPKGLSCREDSPNPQELSNLVLACSTPKDKVIVYGMAYEKSAGANLRQQGLRIFWLE